MKKVWLLSAVSLTVGIAFAGPGPGDQAPNFTLPDTLMVNHSLTQYASKVVFMTFWKGG